MSKRGCLADEDSALGPRVTYRPTEAQITSLGEISPPSHATSTQSNSWRSTQQCRYHLAKRQRLVSLLLILHTEKITEMDIRTSLLILLVAAAASAAPSHEDDPECGECDQRRCRPPLDCVAGQVLDRCGCCMSCAQSEGQRCSDPDLTMLPYGNKYGPCGSDLGCVLRDDLKPEEDPEALCVCNQKQMVCASDGNSYDTICQLRESSQKEGRGDIRMIHWGHCRSAPWIVSAPEPWSGPEHQRLALDCEAKGYPAPEVHWELINADGSSVILPADRSRCAVQLRGGPETFMVTSWLQLLDLGPEDMGNYSCVATNSEGQARAIAKVHIFH